MVVSLLHEMQAPYNCFTLKDLQAAVIDFQEEQMESGADTEGE